MFAPVCKCVRPTLSGPPSRDTNASRASSSHLLVAESTFGLACLDGSVALSADRLRRTIRSRTIACAAHRLRIANRDPLGGGWFGPARRSCTAWAFFRSLAWHQTGAVQERGGVVMANPLANKAGCDRVKAGAFWPMPRKRRTWCGVWWSRSRLALAVVRLWCITTPPPKKCRPVTSAKPHRLLPLKTSSAGSCHRPNHALAMGHQRLQSNAPQPALDRQAGPGPGSASAAWRAWQPAVGETVWARLEACHQRLPDLAGAWPTRSPVREPIGCEHPTRWPIS